MADKKTPDDETPKQPKAKRAGAPRKKKAASSRPKSQLAADASVPDGSATGADVDTESPYRDEPSRLTPPTNTAVPTAVSPMILFAPAVDAHVFDRPGSDAPAPSPPAPAKSNSAE